MKSKIDNYLKTRGLFFFIVFIFFNIAGLLPLENIAIDIFSHFKFQYILINIFFLFLFVYLSFQNRKFLICSFVSLILICFNFADVTVYLGKSDIVQSDNSIKIALFNVLTKNDKYNQFKLIINGQKPDIIILQEIDDVWLENIRELKKDYPYFLEYPRLDNFGIALYSKFPLINPNIETWTDYEVPVITAEIKSNGNILKIYGVHTLPPIGKQYFRVRNEMLSKINEIFSDSKHPLIIAGDLNTSVYSISYKKYIKSSNLKDAQILAKTLKGTWNAKHFPFMRISLEHVFISPEIKVQSFDIGKNFGSDHLPVFVDLSF